MKTAGVIVIIVLLLLVAAAIGWVVFTRMRAARLGLPAPSWSAYIPFRKSAAPSYGPPQPAPGGVQGWISDRLRTFKNRNNRTAAGAYEQSAGGSAARGRQGFGPLDPDEAWDSRVGNDNYGPGGYYEEQELGLAPPHGDTSYAGGGSYSMNLATTPGHEPAGYGLGEHDDEERGRARSRSPGPAAPGAAKGRKNPFDDDAEASNLSLRGVSPRPIDTSGANLHAAGQKEHTGDSPTERRSIFRENV